WACLARKYAHEPEAVAKGPGFCIRDTDGDNLADVAAFGGREIAIHPVALAQLGREFMDESVSTQVIVRLQIKETRPESVFVEGLTDTTIHGFPRWNYSIATQNLDAWPRELQLSNRSTYNLAGVRLQAIRRNGVWTIQVSGAF